jgi:hypothetical protein
LFFVLELKVLPYHGSGMRFALWTLMMAVCGFSALVAAGGVVTDGVFHRKIEGLVEKDGKNYFRLRTWSEGLPRNWDYAKLVRKDEKAVYSLDEGVVGAAEQIEFALPLKIGSSWQWTVGSTVMTDIVEGLETVEISGKIYKNCFHIKRTSADDSIVEDYWQAPGVGDLKSMNVFGDGGKITLTLKEFKPGK